MRRLWNRIRAFLRGPSEEDLDSDLSDIKRRLADLEARREAEEKLLAERDPNVLRFVPGRRRGLEG